MIAQLWVVGELRFNKLRLTLIRLQVLPIICYSRLDQLAKHLASVACKSIEATSLKSFELAGLLLEHQVSKTSSQANQP